jgi:Leucine-rich repeat (LRR) protein
MKTLMLPYAIVLCCAHASLCGQGSLGATPDALDATPSAGRGDQVQRIAAKMLDSPLWLDLKQCLEENQLPYQSVSIDEHGVCRLNLSQTDIVDLSPLRGAKITHLDISHTRVADLGPLEGMKLVGLWLHNSDVSDLAPLKGMPLESLSLWGCKAVVDLSPISQSDLSDLCIRGTNITDLAPVARLPLEYLDARDSPVRELPAWPTGARLQTLLLDGTDVSDLSRLHDVPIQYLSLTGSGGAERGVLRGWHRFKATSGTSLEAIAIDWPSFTSIAALRSLPLVAVELVDTSVIDLSPIQDSSLAELSLAGTSVSDLSPLAQGDLVELHLTEGRSISFQKYVVCSHWWPAPKPPRFFEARRVFNNISRFAPPTTG